MTSERRRGDQPHCLTSPASSPPALSSVQQAATFVFLPTHQGHLPDRLRAPKLLLQLPERQVQSLAPRPRQAARLARARAPRGTHGFTTQRQATPPPVQSPVRPASSMSAPAKLLHGNCFNPTADLAHRIAWKQLMTEAWTRGRAIALPVGHQRGRQRPLPVATIRCRGPQWRTASRVPRSAPSAARRWRPSGPPAGPRWPRRPRTRCAACVGREQALPDTRASQPMHDAQNQAMSCFGKNKAPSP